jgi:hypothetical protein
MANRGMLSEEDGLNLLKAMELVDEDEEIMDVNEDQLVLSAYMVAEIEEARKEGCIKPCEYIRKRGE